jgi:phosphoribosyl-AMP cyclohydrolase
MSQTAAEFPARGTPDEIETGTTFQPRFDADGLIPVIVTQAATGPVLMFAWMNAEALRLTLTTRVAHFWTRSRRRLWKKGEESGNLLDVVEVRTDCDQDVLWLRVTVRGAGVACHTGEPSCFYRTVQLDDPKIGSLRRVPIAAGLPEGGATAAQPTVTD